jgi:hypothetical protein
MTGAYLKTVCVPYLDGPPAAAVATPGRHWYSWYYGPAQGDACTLDGMGQDDWLRRCVAAGAHCCVQGRERRRGRAGQKGS